jgi:hypothetical protein
VIAINQNQTNHAFGQCHDFIRGRGEACPNATQPSINIPPRVGGRFMGLYNSHTVRLDDEIDPGVWQQACLSRTFGE